MHDLDRFQAFLRYSEWANEQLLRAAAGLNDEQLDQCFDMGRGTLRKTFMHLWAGESVWLARWKGKTETPWPDEELKATVPNIDERFKGVYSDRAPFMATLKDADVGRVITYRDSKGSLYKASLGDMIMQGITHSIHHRAQAVNMLRRLGASAPEVDYMYWVRKPA
ncbi:MAG TPA: DinB family protein [Phycisphaerae bacterium]|nr:DinB family protein [Phycisphaerae bacterium]